MGSPKARSKRKSEPGEASHEQPSKSLRISLAGSHGFINPLTLAIPDAKVFAILAKTVVGRHNRTTVPREVRRLLGVKEGDALEWVFEDGKIVVRKAGGALPGKER